jgi:hypothetical protein
MEKWVYPVFQNFVRKIWIEMQGTNTRYKSDMHAAAVDGVLHEAFDAV